MKPMGLARAHLLQPVDRFFEFSLLGLLASGFLALAGSGFLDAPTLLLTAGGIAARLLKIVGVIAWDPSARAVNSLTLLFAGFFPIDYHFLSR